jgi:hypothetical protein
MKKDCTKTSVVHKRMRKATSSDLPAIQLEEFDLFGKVILVMRLETSSMTQA